MTRSLLDLSSAPPVLADLYFAKIWLARRFTAPGCEPVCCDGNAPMPFARGAFGFAMCTDAFMYIWTKRQFVGEMERLVDDGPATARSLIGHTHNERTWSPSHGQPLSPEGYAALFETIEPRAFGEAGLFADVVAGGPLDLVAARRPGDARQRSGADDRREPPSRRVRAPSAAAARGRRRRIPRQSALRRRDADGEQLAPAAARFPSEDYEQEYGACRQYLPEEVTLDAGRRGGAGHRPAVAGDLRTCVRRKVIVDLPKRYY